MWWDAHFHHFREIRFIYTLLTQHINPPLSVQYFFYSFLDWFITTHVHLFDNQCVSKTVLSFFLELSFLRQISHSGVNLKASPGIFSEKHRCSESYTARTTRDQHDFGSHYHLRIKRSLLRTSECLCSFCRFISFVSMTSRDDLITTCDKNVQQLSTPVFSELLKPYEQLHIWGTSLSLVHEAKNSHRILSPIFIENFILCPRSFFDSRALVIGP